MMMNGYTSGRQVEDAMAVLAGWIGKNYGVKVVYHDGSAVDADIFKGIIRIPRLACASGITKEALMLLRGRIYHESGHIGETKLSKKEYPRKKSLFSILNALEDRRMESVLADRYEGCKKVLSWQTDYYNKDIAGKVAEGKVDAPLWEALVAMSFMVESRRPLWKLSEKAAIYVDKAYEEFMKVKSCKSANDCLVLAKVIYDILKEANDEMKEQQEEQKQEQQEQQEKQEEQDSGEEQDKQDSGEGSEDGESNSEEGDEEGQSSSSAGDFEDDEDEEESGDKSGSGDSKDEDSKEDSDEDSDDGSKDGEDGEDSEGSKEDDSGSDSKGEDGEDGDDSEGSSEGSGEDGEEADSKSGDDSDSDDNGESGKEGKEAYGSGEFDMDKECEGYGIEDVLNDAIKTALDDIAPEDARYTSLKDSDIHMVPDVRDDDKTVYKTRREKVSAQVAAMSQALEQALRAMAKCRKNPYLRKGRIDRRRLVQISKGLSKEVFYNTRPGQKLDVAVEVIIDESGSMTNYLDVQLLAMAIGESLDRIGVPFEITGTTTKYAGHDRNMPESNGFTRANPMVYKHYKSFGETWGTVHHRITKTGRYMHNIDGEAVEYCAMKLVERKETRKVIFSLSDGKPMGGEYRDGELGRNLKRVSERCRESGVEVYGFGIGTTAPKSYYGKDYFIGLSSTSEMGPEFLTKFAEIITKGEVKV